MFTDLVPFRTLLVEQCQPLGHSSLQNHEQQCGYEEMEYSLQEHDYVAHGEGNSQMAFILVKQEVHTCILAANKLIFPLVLELEVLSRLCMTYDDSCPQTVLKQEEVEPNVVYGQVLSDKEGEELKLTSIFQLVR